MITDEKLNRLTVKPKMVYPIYRSDSLSNRQPLFHNSYNVTKTETLKKHEWELFERDLMKYFIHALIRLLD